MKRKQSLNKKESRKKVIREANIKSANKEILDKLNTLVINLPINNRVSGLAKYLKVHHSTIVTYLCKQNFKININTKIKVEHIEILISAVSNGELDDFKVEKVRRKLPFARLVSTPM